PMAHAEPSRKILSDSGGGQALLRCRTNFSEYAVLQSVVAEFAGDGCARVFRFSRVPDASPCDDWRSVRRHYRLCSAPASAFLRCRLSCWRFEMPGGFERRAAGLFTAA